MSTPTKRKEAMEDSKSYKKPRMECPHGDKCNQRNPIHFEEYNHTHLESILNSYTGSGDFPIPSKLNDQEQMIVEQLKAMLSIRSTSQEPDESQKQPSSSNETVGEPSRAEKSPHAVGSTENKEMETAENTSAGTSQTKEDSTEEVLPAVLPKDKMAAKHAASAPFFIFYTTIKDSQETHTQPYSITFQEILDKSLGELECSLQITFLLSNEWLLEQYDLAGYSQKKLTILYGEKKYTGSRNITARNLYYSHVDEHHIKIHTSCFGTHHTKMMVLCYEDGSLRVVISTANLYADDWENRTQGLWFSPVCRELPEGSMSDDGESPTMFKSNLVEYLKDYKLSCLDYYVKRVERCDFSNINVFLVASVPGTHENSNWGMFKVGSLLEQHCEYFGETPLIAQASSIGSYGKEPNLWLTGHFLDNFTKTKAVEPSEDSEPPELKIIYPSLQNVRQSHDELLGGGCLSFRHETHVKQLWLSDFLHQWQAIHTARNQAMPHIKSYLRYKDDKTPYYILTSANITKAAWGQVLKKGALRILNYEAGVMFLPKFVINEEFFSLSPTAEKRLIVPYDLPPVEYTPDMNVWISEYLP